MAITLRADNRIIVKDAKYSYLLDSYPSGSTSVSVVNTEGFFHNSYVLFGNVGSENTDILQLLKVDPVTKEITFKNFSDTAVGGGIEVAVINNPGSGYAPGQILSVIQGTNQTGKVRVETVDGLGGITSLFFDQNESGFGYSIGNNIATTGGGDNLATIDITSILPESDDNNIYFEEGKKFIAGQPVEAFDGITGASKGTGTVQTSSNQSENLMILSGVGIPGIVPGDLITVGDLTKFPHSESTRVTVIQYNAIRFFRTDTPSVPNYIPQESLSQKQNKSITQTTKKKISTPHTTVYRDASDPSFEKRIDFTPPIVFQGAVALTDPMPIQVNDFYTTFFDKQNASGYGWFAFLNESTLTYSPISNPIPYAGFPENTVKKVFETFDSSMNTKELQLISASDRYSWLNEGLSSMTNELNLGNWEYFSSDEITLDIIGGIGKYLLPEDFSDLIFMNDSKGRKIESFNPSHPRNPYSPMQYSIRGKFLVFNPVPSSDSSVTFSYLKSSPVLKNLDDVLDLPDNAYYAIKDFMRFRAYQKLGNESEAAGSYALFTKKIENMKIHASKRDKALDSFSVDRYSNI